MTLVEMVLGGMTLSIAIAAILGAYLGQVTLNEHARNLSLAVHDANRVVEQLRQNNDACGATPTATPTAGVNWNIWLQTAPQAKSVPNVNQNAEQLVAVTCQNRAGDTYCPDAQMGDEWHAVGPAGAMDPLQVTVAVCWRHRGRVVGECSWNGTTLSPNNANGNRIIESPAMLTTVITCRG